MNKNYDAIRSYFDVVAGASVPSIFFYFALLRDIALLTSA
jgi:hypothetical protein